MAANLPTKTKRKRQTAQQRYRKKEELGGIGQLNVRAPTKWSRGIKSFVGLLREGKQPSAAFASAFPASVKGLLKQHKLKITGRA
jgi:hypothetical protein